MTAGLPWNAPHPGEELGCSGGEVRKGTGEGPGLWATAWAGTCLPSPAVLVPERAVTAHVRHSLKRLCVNTSMLFLFCG